MEEYGDYSTRERKQLAVCQYLITEKSYLSQEEIRRDLQNHGSNSISQSAVSWLLKLLGVIKIRDTKGQKIYSVNPQLLLTPNVDRSVAEVAPSAEHSGEFILIRTVAGYGRAAARTLDFHALLEIFGMAVDSNVVWVAPYVAKHTTLMYKQINYLLKLNIYS